MCRGGWGSRSADSSQEIFLPPTIPRLPECLLLSVTCQPTTETNQPTAAWVNRRQWWGTKQRLAGLRLHSAGANTLWEGEEIYWGERDFSVFSNIHTVFSKSDDFAILLANCSTLQQLKSGQYKLYNYIKHLYFVSIDQDTHFFMSH